MYRVASRLACVYVKRNAVKQFSTEADLSILLSHETKQRCVQSVSQLPVKQMMSEFFMKRLVKKAAVLIPLCEVNGEPSLLFTVRSPDLRRNKGQVSFPGGGMDGEDKSLVDTALREMEEEIGFPKHKVDIWATFPPYPDWNLTLAVHCILGNMGPVNVETLKPNEDEVASIFTVPIKTLLDPPNVRYTKFRINSRKPSRFDHTMSVYMSEPKIWGLTATFVDMTLGVLFGNHKRVVKIYENRARKLSRT